MSVIRVWLFHWNSGFSSSGYPEVGFLDHCCCCFVVKSCLTLCDSVNCSLPGSSVCSWDFPGKNIGWIAISFSRGSSLNSDRTHVPCIGRQIVYHWATREALVGSHDGSIFNFFGNPCFWQKLCLFPFPAMVYRIPVSQHPYHYLLSFFFFIIASLEGLGDISLSDLHFSDL